MGFLAQAAGMPAAWLVGPMLAAVFVALAVPERRPKIPVWARRGAQATVGCVLAANFTPAIVPMVASEWFAVTIALAGTLIMSLLGALLLTWISPIDAKTAQLGVLPGAASGILAMSDSLGADVRLVAVMQYGRVVLVVASATVVASFGASSASPVAGGTAPVGSVEGLMVQSQASVYALTAIVAVAGMLVGVRLGLPAGALIGPLVLAIGLEEAGVVHVAVPGVVSPFAYALIGIYVGLLFDRASLRQAWGLLPYILASTLALMAVCAVLGFIFAALTGTDYLTAYLATTPGAIDSVAIMAVDSGADASLVLAVQMLRLLLVVLAGAVLGYR